ncbi:MAG: peptidylprolyl isomerase [Planctomycetota bacterium]
MNRTSLSLAALGALVSACATADNRDVARDAVPIGPAPETLEPPQPEAPESSLPTQADPTGAGPAPRVAGAGDAAAAALRPTGDVNWPSGVDAQDGAVPVASVGGRDILLTDLVSKWMLRDPDGVRAILDDLVLSRIVAMESGALGIELPKGSVEGVVRDRVRVLGERAQAAGAPDLESFVKARLGMEPTDFEQELVQEAAVDLLAPRCVRAWLLGSERREFRVIVVETQAGADEVQARLAAGEDFAALARELSVDPSKSEGGRMPPVVRGDQPLARTAFAANLGEVVGPIEEGEGFVFLVVDETGAPRTGSWTDIGAEVEESLERRGVEDPEFWQWKDAMFRRYEIDVSPFLRLTER